MKILVINAGSSTYKCALYDLVSATDVPQDPIWKGSVDFKNHQDPSHLLHDLLESAPLKQIDAIGHRVVHGGESFREPTLITEEVKNKIRELIPLAPLHNPVNLEGIVRMEKFFPKIPQIAVFDTAFHQTLSPVASTYPVPYSWKEMGIRRFGFHGISHAYCCWRAKQMAKTNCAKIISCHLGNGVSLAAVKDGCSIDTTMGFTPMEGVMMGSRSGSIDPGILFFLMKEKGFQADTLDRLLNFESGFKGICGQSDLREVEKLIAQSEKQAELALEMFVHSLKKNIGAMAAVLDGPNLLIFTGGIGENSATVRKKVCKGLSFLGIDLNEALNDQKPDADISNSNSKVRILIIHTREDLEIAKESYHLLLNKNQI